MIQFSKKKGNFCLNTYENTLTQKQKYVIFNSNSKSSSSLETTLRLPIWISNSFQVFPDRKKIFAIPFVLIHQFNRCVNFHDHAEMLFLKYSYLF